MIWFGAVGFGGQPGQPKPPTPWNDWRILKSSDKKKEFDHHFTSYLCLMRSTPQTLSNTIRAFFSSWGTKNSSQPTTWSRSQTSNVHNAPLAFVSAHPSFNPFFFVRRSQIPTTRTRKKRSGLGHHQIQGAKYKILCFQGLFGSEIFSSNIWELKEIG